MCAVCASIYYRLEYIQSGFEDSWHYLTLIENGSRGLNLLLSAQMNSFHARFHSVVRQREEREKKLVLIAADRVGRDSSHVTDFDIVSLFYFATAC